MGVNSVCEQPYQTALARWLTVTLLFCKKIRPSYFVEQPNKERLVCEVHWYKKWFLPLVN